LKKFTSLIFGILAFQVLFAQEHSDSERPSVDSLSMMLEEELSIVSEITNSDGENLNFLIEKYQDLRRQNLSIYYKTIHFMDELFSANRSAQFAIELPGKSTAIYLPNYRQDKFLSPDKAKEELKKMKNKAAEKNIDINNKFELSLGRINEIKKRIVWLEYVKLFDEKIVVTETNMGHILLADGQPVLGAGQIMIVKNKKEQINMVVVTNASGSFMPNFEVTHHVRQQVKQIFNISEEKIVTTVGEPLSSQLLKLNAKLDIEINKQDTSSVESIKEKKERADELFSSRFHFVNTGKYKALSCKFLF